MTVPVPVYATYWRFDQESGLQLRIQASGALREQDQRLVLEYQEKWRDPATLRSVEGPARRADVECAALADVDVRRDWLGRAWVVLYARTFDALRGWPGARGDKCRLRVSHHPRHAHLEAAGELAVSVADARLRSLESGAKDPADRNRDAP